MKPDTLDRSSVAYTVFDVETGKILRTGDAQRCDLIYEAQSSREIVIEGTYRASEYTVEVTEAGPQLRRRRLPAISAAQMRIDAKRAADEQVRAECARRLQLIYGARDIGHLERLISEDTLLIFEGDEAAISRRAKVKAHDAASKTLRAMSPVPTDYDNHRHWPA